MGIKEKLMGINFFKDEKLYKKYGDNVYDMGMEDTIEKGIVEKLMNARDLDIPYCVVFGSLTPMGTRWDPYGNGEWHPPRDYIATDDIATEDNNREQERQNVYAFLRGEVKAKEEGRHK